MKLLQRSFGVLFTICNVLNANNWNAVNGFCSSPSRGSSQRVAPGRGHFATTHSPFPQNDEKNPTRNEGMKTEWARRDIFGKAAKSMSVFGGVLVGVGTDSNAAVGSLYEYGDANAVVQGITINVADFNQQESMIKFLQDSFDFKVLRRRRVGTITDTWLGFGPEELNVPKDFEFPVSSFGQYGGHASLHIRYDSQTASPFYTGGTSTTSSPGDNIAFLQVGVPSYRISQMVKNGGSVLDAYGIVNVISPAGLPMRGIVGIWPDPIMFVAVRCQDVQKSRVFYEQLGFVEQPYPYARPSKGTGQFEPPQPPKSVYLSPSPNCMGVLLLPNENKRKAVVPNPVLRSLNILYTPSTTASDDADLQLFDPSGVPLNFVSVSRFDDEERNTKLNMQVEPVQ